MRILRNVCTINVYKSQTALSRYYIIIIVHVAELSLFARSKAAAV
jgi:hypothetical protein